MRLFTEGETPSITLSTEEFNTYYQTASVVSLEAISDYLYKIKDGFSTLKTKLIDLNQDKVLTEAMSTRFETLHVIKRLSFVNVKDHTVYIPESFSGKYVDYVEDLTEVASRLVPATQSTLNNLKLAISSFINEYSEDKVHTLYGLSYFKEAEKQTKVATEKVSEYFKTNSHATQAPISAVLKNLADVDQIYKNLSKLEAAVNLASMEQINKLALDVSDLVDLIIEQNSKTGILLKNNSAKKDLVNIIQIAAKQVEAAAYVYSNTIFLYTAIKRLSERLIVLGNTK